MSDSFFIDIVARDQASAQMRAMADAIRGFATQADAINRKFGEFAGGRYFANQMREMRAEMDSATQAFVNLNQVGGGVNYGRLVNENMRANLSFKSAAESAEVFKKSVVGLEEVGLKIEHGWRHVVAVFDESMRGQRGAMISSVSAFLRDTGLMQKAIENLATPWTAVAAAGVAALGAMAYAAEQTHQRFLSLRQTTGELALRGGGAGALQQQETAQEFDRLKSATNEYAGTIKVLEEQLNKLPIAARPVRLEIGQMAEALAGIRHEDPAKAIEPFIKAAEHGGDSLAKFVEESFDLKGVLDSSGMTLSEHVRLIADEGQKYQTVVTFINAHRGAVLAAGTAARQASHDLSIYTDALLMSESAAAGNAIVAERQGEKINKAADAMYKAVIASDEMTSAMKAQGEAIAAGNKILDDRIKLLDEIGKLRVAQSELSRPHEGTAGRGEPAEATRAANAAANKEAQARRGELQQKEEEDHQLRLEHIRAEAEARKDDLEAQKAAAQARLDEAEKMARIRFPGGDLSQDVDVQRARTDVQKAQAIIEDQAAKNQIADLRAIADEAQRGSQERIDAENEIIRITKARIAAGRMGEQELGQEKQKLANLTRQLETRNFQEARDNARAQVELARGNVQQIIAAYNELRAAATATGQIPAVFAQINREEIRDLKSAQAQAFSASEQYESALERLDKTRLSAAKAALDTQVISHQISKDKAAQLESDLTSKSYAEAEKRVQAEIDADNTTDAQKQKLYEHLAQLYEDDANKQIEAQKKVTQAIEAENAKREKSFTNMFDQVGTGLENFITAGLTRSQTRAQAFQALGRTIVSSIVKETGTLASDYAGRALGPHLGLTAEESKGGLGSVLGKSLFKALGMEEETPKDAMAGVAEKMSAAVAAQEKAANLQSEAANNLNEAAQALREFAGKSGANASTAKLYSDPMGEMTPTSGEATYSSDKALALIQKYESSGGQNVKNFRFDPTHTAQGYFQITDTTWRDIAQKSGIPEVGQYSHAMAAPFDVQEKAAKYLYDTQGFAPWANFNPKLKEAIREKEGFSGGGAVPILPAGAGGDDVSGRANDPSNLIGRGADSLLRQKLREIDESTEMPGFFRRKSTEGSGGGVGPDFGAAGAGADQEMTQLKATVDQLNTSVRNEIPANQQAGNSIQQLGQDYQTNATDVKQASDAVKDLGNSSKTASTKVDSSSSSTSSGLGTLQQGLGTASSVASGFGVRLSSAGNALVNLPGTISQVTGFAKNLGTVFDSTSSATKGVSTATSLLQTATTGNTIATTLNTTATTANSAAESAGGAGGIAGKVGGGLLSIFGLEHGGIIPSAQGGMIVGGGQMAILHPREMVLPAHLSTGIQNMINRGEGGGNNIANLTYNANVTGYHPYASRSSFESMLRTHGDALFAHAENWARNNFRV